MRSTVVVLGAIGTIEITTIRHVKTALQRFAVDEALARFQNVIAGKFAADFFEKLHAIMKEHAAYDNLPAKQSRWEISLITPAIFPEEFQRASDKPQGISPASAIPARRQSTFSSNRTNQYHTTPARSECSIDRRPT